MRAPHLALALAGCGTGGYSTEGSQGAGKRALHAGVRRCHALADAGTAGTIGPNLDDAFAQARADGMTTDTFTQVVRDQILFPITETSTGAPGMPAPGHDASRVRRRRGRRVLRRGPAAGRRGHRRLRRSRVAGHRRRPPEAPSATASRSSPRPAAPATRSPTPAPRGQSGRTSTTSKPSKELVVDRVTNGQGAMPSFEDQLDPAQIEAVAEYVSSVAGK